MKMNFKRFILLTTGFSLFLLGFYVFQIQVVMGNDYKIEGYEKNISQLSKNNRLLEIEANEFDSLEKIESKVSNLGLVKVDEVKYIFITEDYLARETQ